jgi:hypothetical protein
MTDPNYKFAEQGSVVPVSKRGWREETLLNAITADIEYKYYFYSDKRYIEKQKKMLNDAYDLEWLTLYKDSVIDFIKRIKRINDTAQTKKAYTRFLPILRERNKLLAEKFRIREETPKELSRASGRKSHKHRKSRKHRKSLRHKRK